MPLAERRLRLMAIGNLEEWIQYIAIAELLVFSDDGGRMQIRFKGNIECFNQSARDYLIKIPLYTNYILNVAEHRD
ncbi:hypothetical protein Dimus_008840 [Dionaea muscipula]